MWIRQGAGRGVGGWLGYFDGWKGKGRWGRGLVVNLLRIARRRVAGVEESGLWVAVVGLDDLVDGVCGILTETVMLQDSDLGSSKDNGDHKAASLRPSIRAGDPAR